MVAHTNLHRRQTDMARLGMVPKAGIAGVRGTRGIAAGMGGRAATGMRPEGCGGHWGSDRLDRACMDVSVGADRAKGGQSHPTSTH